MNTNIDSDTLPCPDQLRDPRGLLRHRPYKAMWLFSTASSYSGAYCTRPFVLYSTRIYIYVYIYYCLSQITRGHSVKVAREAEKRYLSPLFFLVSVSAAGEGVEGGSVFSER